MNLYTFNESLMTPSSAVDRKSVALIAIGEIRVHDSHFPKGNKINKLAGRDIEMSTALLADIVPFFSFV